MSEGENIEQCPEDGKSERPEEADETTLHKETISAIENDQQLTTYNVPLITQEMEVHHHPHIEKKNFKEYFLEFLMIFLAVTMGFFAENVRESISDNNKQDEYVRSLYNDMQLDSININTALNFDSLQINGIDKLIDILNQPLPDSNEINAAYFFARVITRTKAFEQADRTIQQLNNSGNFRLIKNKALADSIIEYENNVATYKNNHSVGMEERRSLYPFIATIFDANVFQIMVDSTNHITRTTGTHSINKRSEQLNNQFIYYLHQEKSTIVAEKINLLKVLGYTSVIRKIIANNYKIQD